MRVLTAEAMAKVDRRAVEELGVPSLVLMENAALGVVDALVAAFPGARRIAVLCGPGNNGGDGLAVARHLHVRGFAVDLYTVLGGRVPKGDAAQQLDICRNLGLNPEEIATVEALGRLQRRAHRWDVVVDALFGTGLKRPLEGLVAELVAAMNDVAAPCLAVDLPSGLAGSTGRIPGPHVLAQVTVTFAAPKLAHILPPAVHAVGQVVVADLGVPAELVEEAEGNLHLLVADELAAYLQPRPAVSHKGDYGHLLVVSGSTGKGGAAILAAQGAVRSGAGLVTVGVPSSVLTAVDLGSVESMTLPLPTTAAGSLAAEAAEVVLEAAQGKDALAVGPGVGQDPATVAAVRRLVLESTLPLVLDADGVNAFAGEAAALGRRAGDTLLTPHPGELGRLLGVPTREVVADRLASAARGARQSGSVVVLKGHQSLVATPEGEIHINPTGNPGMATGGSGDVLTGMAGALLAQGYEVLAAAQLAVYLHGLAGDLASERQGVVGVRAGDVLELVPQAFRELARS